MKRSVLSDSAWAAIRRLLPPPTGRGRPPRDPRVLLEGVLWVLRTGAPWRDLPDRFGPWQTVYGRFRAWAREGRLDHVLSALHRRLRRARRLDLSLWCVDTTVIRASRAAGGAPRRPGRLEPEDHALGRSRGGFGTKLSLVCDGQGAPLAVAVGPGQEHDIRRFPDVCSAAFRVGRPRRLAGDKAYSVRWVRRWLCRRGVRPVIPTRCDQAAEHRFDLEAYRRRNVVERLVSWLKESRRVATRYEKLAEAYLGMVKLALIARLLRILDEFSNKP